MSRIKILMMVVSGLFMMIGIITMVSAGAEAAPLNEDSVPVFYENIIQSAGHKIAGSVSGNTDYLVIADTNSTSSKAKKARSLGTKLISPAELEEMFSK